MNTLSKVLIDSDKNIVAIISSTCQNVEDAAKKAIPKHLVGLCDNVTEIKFEDPSSDGIIQPVKATGVTIKGDIATYQFYLIVKDTYN